MRGLHNGGENVRHFFGNPLWLDPGTCNMRVGQGEAGSDIVVNGNYSSMGGGVY